MSTLIEVTAPRLRRKAPALDHIEIHAHPAGTPERPAWTVVHVNDDGGAHGFEFQHGRGQDLLVHVANHIGVPEPAPHVSEGSGYSDR